MSDEQNYNIHEKIAQLETELLQHELLIRRQKHVIISLKNMINNPANQGMLASPSVNAAYAPIAVTNLPPPAPAPAPAVTNRILSTLPPNAAPAVRVNTLQQAAPSIQQSSTSSTGKKAPTAAAVAPVRAINLMKKRSAIDKVSLAHTNEFAGHVFVTMCARALLYCRSSNSARRCPSLEPR